MSDEMMKQCIKIVVYFLRNRDGLVISIQLLFSRDGIGKKKSSWDGTRMQLLPLHTYVLHSSVN